MSSLSIRKGTSKQRDPVEAARELHAAIGPPQRVLGCNCILRRLETDRHGTKERIGDIFARNNAIGFATCGERLNSMHVNQTFTRIAIGSRA